MLYIKEQVGLNTYLVHDTDDNSDEVTTVGDIYNCIFRLGITIEGACVTNKGNLEIAPFMVDNYKKVTKLHLKTGVLLCINNDKLCRVNVKDLESSDISINLDDYCSELACACFSNIRSDYRLTLSLSDNLKFTNKAFMDCEISNLTIDLTNLSNKIASSVYNHFLSLNRDCLTMDAHIPCLVIDSNKKRLAYYQIIKALTLGNDTLRRVYTIINESIYQSAMQEVLKVYRPKWIEVFKGNIDLASEGLIPSISVVNPNTETILNILKLINNYMVITSDESRSTVKRLIQMMLTYFDSFEGALDFDLAEIIFNKGQELVRRYNL